MEQIFGVDKRCLKIINTSPKYSLKIQINLIFSLTGLYNFIKNYLLEDIDNFQYENKDAIIQSGGSNNLLLDNSLVTFT